MEVYGYRVDGKRKGRFADFPYFSVFLRTGMSFSFASHASCGFIDKLINLKMQVAKH